VILCSFCLDGKAELSFPATTERIGGPPAQFAIRMLLLAIMGNDPSPENA